jgi:hypothetical protein
MMYKSIYLEEIKNNLPELVTSSFAFGHHLLSADIHILNSLEDSVTAVLRSVLSGLLAGLITHLTKLLIQKIYHKKRSHEK